MASEGRTRCQVVVVGDQGTGKSSLVTAVATDSFPERVPAVLPPTRLPHDFYPDRVPLVIIDSSSRQEDKAKMDMECKKADAIVLTYACDRPQTLERLSSHWLPELRALEIKVRLLKRLALHTDCKVMHAFGDHFTHHGERTLPGRGHEVASNGPMH